MDLFALFSALVYLQDLPKPWVFSFFILEFFWWGQKKPEISWYDISNFLLQFLLCFCCTPLAVLFILAWTTRYQKKDMLLIYLLVPHLNSYRQSIPQAVKYQSELYFVIHIFRVILLNSKAKILATYLVSLATWAFGKWNKSLFSNRQCTCAVDFLMSNKLRSNMHLLTQNYEWPT